MTQVLSTDLTFDDGSPVYGARYCQYLGLIPTTATGETYDVGYLHDGYAASTKNCAVYPTGATTDTYCYMTRDVLATAAIVIGNFRLKSVSGAPVFGDLVEWSVFARVQGGTLTQNGTVNVRYVDVTGYQFRVYTVGTNFKFEVRKFASGVATSLGSYTILSSLVDPLASATMGIALVVVGSVSPVTVSAWVYYISPSTGQPTAPIQLFNISDSSSPITTAGRAGFGMGAARAFTNGTGVDLCPSFEVRTSTNVTVIRDEWVRHALQACATTPADANGITGKALQGQFNKDQFAAAGPYILRDAGSNRVYVNLNSSTTNKAQVFLNLRPADDESNHHRSVDIVLATTGATSLGGGVMVYASDTSGATSQTGELGFTTLRGYAAVCKFTGSGSVYTVSVYRYDSTAVPALIAQLSVAAPGSGAEPFPVLSSFTLGLEAYPTDNQGGYPNASVTLKVYVDAVQVVLLPVVGVPTGITVNSAGTVVDANSKRVKGGTGEGFYVCGATRGTLVYFDTWTQGALHDPDQQPPGQPSLSFGDEGTASTTIDDVLTPAWSVDVEYSADPISVQYDSGHRYTAPRHSSAGLVFARRTWGVSSPPLTLSERNAVQDFYIARLGLEQAFNFTDPRTGDTVKVHFADDSFSATKAAPGTHYVSFTLEELI